MCTQINCYSTKLEIRKLTDILVLKHYLNTFLYIFFLLASSTQLIIIAEQMYKLIGTSKRNPLNCIIGAYIYMEYLSFHMD